MSGNIFGCHNGGEGDTGILWVEARGCLHSVSTGCQPGGSYLAQNVGVPGLSGRAYRQEEVGSRRGCKPPSLGSPSLSLCITKGHAGGKLDASPSPTT